MRSMDYIQSAMDNKHQHTLLEDAPEDPVQVLDLTLTDNECPWKIVVVGHVVRQEMKLAIQLSVQMDTFLDANDDDDGCL